jgi:hypothetical protein
VNHVARPSALDKWHLPRMGQQDVVDAGSIESKRKRIFLVQLATTLVQSAVDQDPRPSALDHMT